MAFSFVCAMCYCSERIRGRQLSLVFSYFFLLASFYFLLLYGITITVFFVGTAKRSTEVDSSLRVWIDFIVVFDIRFVVENELSLCTIRSNSVTLIIISDKIDTTLCDLGKRINLTPLSTFRCLGLFEAKHIIVK